MPINIHGKEYITVNERVLAVHKEHQQVSITTELVNENPIVFKATVTTPKGTFTGYSYANPGKAIEKQSPYEVAETSAVGRALGFAGYGIDESIASADEMYKAIAQPETKTDRPEPDDLKAHCKIHDVDMKQEWSERTKKYYWCHFDENNKRCFGK